MRGSTCCFRPASRHTEPEYACRPGRSDIFSHFPRPDCYYLSPGVEVAEEADGAVCRRGRLPHDGPNTSPSRVRAPS